MSFLQNPRTVRANEKEYLLVLKKDSHVFIDILRGKWKSPLFPWITQLTCTEIKKLQSLSFEQLWRQTMSKHFCAEKCKAIQFSIFLHRAHLLLQQVPKHHVSPEWGFPKGRRDKKEDPFECALREFEEETSISRDQLHFHDQKKQIVESFVGSDQIKYTHIYWLAEVRDPYKSNFQPNREIINMGWFSQREAKLLFRPYDFAKLQALQDAQETRI